MKSVVLLVSMIILPYGAASHASDTINDIYGPVGRIEEWPVYNGTSLQGYMKTITVNGQAYPLDPNLKVVREINPPAMYPREQARLSDVQPGTNVDLRLSGHMVFEIVIER
jgi:hypothetical protein